MPRRIVGTLSQGAFKLPSFLTSERAVLPENRGRPDKSSVRSISSGSASGSNIIQGPPLLRTSLPDGLPSFCIWNIPISLPSEDNLINIYFFALSTKTKPLSLPSPALEPTYLLENVFFYSLIGTNGERHLHLFFTWLHRGSL